MVRVPFFALPLQVEAVTTATREFPSPFAGREGKFSASVQVCGTAAYGAGFCKADLASITWMPLCRLTSWVTCMSAAMLQSE
jgi:hypothetical protein